MLSSGHIPLEFVQFFSPLLTIIMALASVHAQPPVQSAECKKAASDCESATDCVHRLAVLQSAWWKNQNILEFCPKFPFSVTNTCQPQCREAALNLYQNREGRALLRTDASCVPGRYELEKCGFLPNKQPKHCSFAKLICETDLQASCAGPKDEFTGGESWVSNFHRISANFCGIYSFIPTPLPFSVTPSGKFSCLSARRTPTSWATVRTSAVVIWMPPWPPNMAPPLPHVRGHF